MHPTLAPHTRHETPHHHGFPDVHELKHSTAGPGKRLNILLAHRPCNFREYVDKTLRGAGYSVKVADDTTQTILILNDEKPPKPDVLVIENDLPNLGAIKTIGAARSVTDIGGLRIILLSENLKVDPQVLHELQIKDVLTKPTPVDVLRAIQRLDRNTL